MNPWEALVVIVVVAALFSIARRHLASPPPDEPLLPGSPGEAAVRKELADLRERVAVLERILTDERKSRDLAREIESLRQD